MWVVKKFLNPERSRNRKASQTANEAEVPNDETIAAIHDAREGRKLTVIKAEQLEKIVEGL